MNIPKEVFDRLDFLAVKLGQTTSALWATLLAQQKIEGTALLVAAIATGLLIGVKAFTLTRGEDSKDGFRGTIVALFGIMVVGSLMYWAVTDLLNPAYGALIDLTRLLNH